MRVIQFLLTSLCLGAVSSLSPPPPSWLTSLTKRDTGHTETSPLTFPIMKHLNDLIGGARNEIGATCKVCKDVLQLGKEIANIEGGRVLAQVIGNLCESDYASSRVCRLMQNHPMAVGPNYSSLLTDVAHALTLMDPQGLDGELFCRYFFFKACSEPELPEIDLSHWWPPKPKDAKEPKSSGKTFNVVHISDIHYQKGYVVGSEGECLDFMCCTDSSMARGNRQAPFPAPPMGYYKCDSPESLIQSTMGNIMNVSRDYEFAIFTGDMVDHDPILISYEDSIAEEEESMKYMKTYLGGIPVYPVLGNHDTYPFSQVAQDSSGYFNLFTWNSDLMSKIWEEYGWLNSEGAQQVREHYGGFAVTTSRGLRIITINSNFWYSWNMYNYWNTTNPDTSGVLKFLTNELLLCEKTNQRAWIMAHVPPNTRDALPIPSIALTQIFERFSPHVIAGIFFGHTHQDEIRLLYASDKGQEATKDAKSALNTAWIGPSITPLTNYNPGWRYYEVDAETFSIMDSHNFHTRLNDTFEQNLDFLDWSHLYSARSFYNKDKNWWPADAPLNATFWHEIASQFKYDSSLVQEYLHNGFRRSPHTPDCDEDECSKKFYCVATSFNPVQQRLCENEEL